MTAPERVGDPPARGRVSAPPRERVNPAPPRRTRGSQGGGGAPRARSAAAEPARPRRTPRGDRWLRLVPRRASAIAPKAPFVIMVMAVLATGLAAILWLSTQAATDSYRLETARKQTTDLSSRVEQLRREVAEMDSAPSLARRAQELGLVPAGDPARLVVRPDGTITVYGSPTPAKAPPAPPPTTQAVPPPAPAPPAPTSPVPTTQQQGRAGGGGG
ncbi:hypothetical protein [Gandjariella thermophila]|uniref:Cell division protein FtsL n=1 Tax=Gandjariella thermophila TaxID=1931992 RepID=A0A4D4JG11_9PSEU|nr:hypothetical protein [Gandjariella thermophila]GDY32827.1 hypothetical protein GTS_44600 [Gandjariella thermophila]